MCEFIYEPDQIFWTNMILPNIFIWCARYRTLSLKCLVQFLDSIVLCVSLRAHFCIKSGRMLFVLVSQLWKSLHYFRRRRCQICKLACILLSFKLLCYFWLTWVQQLWCFSNDMFRQKFLTSFIKGPDLHCTINRSCNMTICR